LCRRARTETCGWPPVARTKRKSNGKIFGWIALSGACDNRSPSADQIQGDCLDDVVKNTGCYPRTAGKNVAAANNGSNLIRAVMHANIAVPKFYAKGGGKPPLKGAGWPKIRIIGAGRNGSKTLNYGAWIIQIGRRGKRNRTPKAGRRGRLKSRFQPFPSLSPEEMFCDGIRWQH